MSNCFLLYLCISCLSAAEPLQENESVFIYCDSVYNSAFKGMKSQFKETLSARKVSWKVKSAKNPSYTALVENIEKDLLKSKADRFILALGTAEFWDAKKKTGTAYNADTFKAALEKTIETLKSKGKIVVLCTPHQVLAGKEAQANTALSKAAETIRSLAKSSELSCCDFYTAFDQKNSSGEAKRMKGITTKDGYKLNDEGENIVTALSSQALSLSSTALTRDLQEGDIVAFAGPAGGKTMKDFSLKLKEHYKDMKFMAPRAIGIYLSHDVFGAKLLSEDAFKSNKPTIIFIYPGSTILGKKTQFKSLDDGTFKTMFQEKVETIRSLLPQAQLFICTPLIHREESAPNLVKIGGSHYQTCEKWAQQTKEVADVLGIPVLDIYQKCLEYINANGAEAAKFAGVKSTYINELEPAGLIFIKKAIAQTINFDAYSD